MFLYNFNISIYSNYTNSGECSNESMETTQEQITRGEGKVPLARKIFGEEEDFSSLKFSA